MEHIEITSHTGASRIARNPDISQIGGKNTKKITFGYHQRRVLELLAKGGQHSAADISAILHLSDPRGIIRELRQKGVVIDDVWCDAIYGTRYKRYFLRKEGANEK